MPRALHLVENVSAPTDPRVWPECVALRDAGWAVTVVSPVGRDRDTARHETVDGIEIHRFATSESKGGVVGYVSEYVVALREIRRIVQRLSTTQHFDVVHAATPPDLLLVAARPLRRRGAAMILDHHDLSPELYEAKFGKRGPVHRSLLLAERVGLGLADVVISPNESFRAVAIERGRKAPEDVFVVRNGPDPTVFHPVARDASLAGGAPHVIGYVGRMGSQDGIPEALGALEELLGLRSDWHAVFAGDGEMLERARSLVSSGRLADHVTFTGFVDQSRVVQIIASCDVCISPEPRNPFNDRATLIKVAEYMAVGRPVVAFDLAETAETAGTAATRVDDSLGFARAISDLFDDPELRRRMGEDGRARVERVLSWPQQVSGLHAAYARALAHRQ
jgi:glycosyltransferase involved in cell wall biosynthesis